MIKKSMLIVIAVFAMFTASLAFAQDTAKPHAFLIQDNEFRYYYGSWFRDPFVTVSGTNIAPSPSYPYSGSPGYTGKGQNLSKNVIDFIHVDLGNKLGDNLFSMEYMSDNTANPVSVGYFHDSTHVGSKDIYMIFRHDLVIDRLVNKNLGVGPIKNWFIEMGADFSAKNDDFSNQRRSPMIGPGVNFKVPNGGYLKVAALWTREWNNEGTDVTSFWYTGESFGEGPPTISPVSSIDSPLACYGYQACVPSPHTWGQKVVYSPREVTFQTSWGLPFALGRAPFIFEGYSTLNTAKGYGAPQLEPFTGENFYPPYTEVWYHEGTRPEWKSDGVVAYNMGSLFKEGGSHVWQIGVGYDYWHNEFGVPQDPPLSGVPNATYQCTSCIGNSPYIVLAVHL